MLECWGRNGRRLSVLSFQQSGPGLMRKQAVVLPDSSTPNITPTSSAIGFVPPL